MARAGQAESLHPRGGRGQKGFAKRINDHIAFALVVYTLMLIFVVTPSVETKGMSIFPYFLVVLLVAMVIPFFRRFESKWAKLEKSELGINSLKTRFAIDRIQLWMIAFGVPFLLSIICGMIKAVT